MDHTMFKEDIAAYDPAMALRYHRVEAGGGKHHRKQVDACCRGGKVTRKSMGFTDGRKGVIANLPAHRAILGCGASNGYFVCRHLRTLLHEVFNDEPS
jgi:hypothetical protein